MVALALPVALLAQVMLQLGFPPPALVALVLLLMPGRVIPLVAALVWLRDPLALLDLCVLSGVADAAAAAAAASLALCLWPPGWFELPALSNVAAVADAAANPALRLWPPGLFELPAMSSTGPADAAANRALCLWPPGLFELPVLSNDAAAAAAYLALRLWPPGLFELPALSNAAAAVAAANRALRLWPPGLFELPALSNAVAAAAANHALRLWPPGLFELPALSNAVAAAAANRALHLWPPGLFMLPAAAVAAAVAAAANRALRLWPPGLMPRAQPLRHASAAAGHALPARPPLLLLCRPPERLAPHLRHLPQIANCVPLAWLPLHATRVRLRALPVCALRALPVPLFPAAGLPDLLMSGHLQLVSGWLPPSPRSDQPLMRDLWLVWPPHPPTGFVWPALPVVCHTVCRPEWLAPSYRALLRLVLQWLVPL